MSSTYGKLLKLSIFGQSHSPAIGFTLDGLPAGFNIDCDELSKFMARRAPGNNEHSTSRKEADTLEFLSGILENTTCGAPLTAIIRNTNTRSGDYAGLRDTPRPAHADFTANVKYGGFQDIAGGGHFSGRLTAPLCGAGGICMQLLKVYGIEIAAHIYSIHNVPDALVTADLTELARVKDKAFPVISDMAGDEMRKVIAQAKSYGDSVGGIIQCIITGVPAGVGEPMFDGLENQIAQIVFGIPAVKGIEFGAGFASASMLGSESNDQFIYEENTVKTSTNNHGGILGGISSGMPIVFRAAIKPTPSISAVQQTVSLSQMKSAELEIKGRHDPCIVPRAVPCMEAAAAIAILDSMLECSKIKI